jgi:hypothetical protein
VLRVVAALALLGGTPAAARAGVKMQGDPARTGILAIDCSVRLVDRSVSSSFFARALRDSTARESEIMCRPWLVRTDRPEKRIGPRQQGDLFFFSGLEPGVYRLDVVIGIAPESALPGERPSSTIRTLDYDPGRDGARLLTVKLSAGDAYYLGRMTIYDARFQDSNEQMGDEPPIRTVLARRLSDAVQAFGLLAKAARRSAWDARLAELSRTMATASVRDTSFEW